jgi:hypothetical protein
VRHGVHGGHDGHKVSGGSSGSGARRFLPLLYAVGASLRRECGAIGDLEGTALGTRHGSGAVPWCNGGSGGRVQDGTRGKGKDQVGWPTLLAPATWWPRPRRPGTGEHGVKTGAPPGEARARRTPAPQSARACFGLESHRSTPV